MTALRIVVDAGFDANVDGGVEAARPPADSVVAEVESSAGREHGALGRAEDQRMGDTVGPTHPRCSAEHFAALDDGRAVTAVLALATRRILSCDLKG